MNIYRCLIIIKCILILSGCGTFLSVGETTTSADTPKGVAVNKRVNYETEIKLGVNEAVKGSLNGIDTDKVLVINGRRMPFSTGKLEITLTKEQLTSKVGITSQTGATRTAQAAGEIKKLTEKPEK